MGSEHSLAVLGYPSTLCSPFAMAFARVSEEKIPARLGVVLKLRKAPGRVLRFLTEGGGE